jgi:hypothetical protein
MRLWRPTGPKEKGLIEETGRFPPRLPEQPIFYPVLNFDYAEQIARDWNSKRADSDYLGFVFEFDITDAVVKIYPPQVAGAAAVHRELWVPAEDLDKFNAAIEGRIRLVAAYRDGARMEM